MANKYFLSLPRLPFYSVICFLWCAQACQFDVVPLVCIYFCCLWFWCHIQEIIIKTNVKKLSPCFPLGVLQFHVLCSSLFSVDFYEWCETRVQFSSFVGGYTVFLAPFVDKAVLFPLWCLNTVTEDQSSLCIYFWLYHSCSSLFSVFLYITSVRWQQRATPLCQQLKLEVQP